MSSTHGIYSFSGSPNPDNLSNVSSADDFIQQSLLNTAEQRFLATVISILFVLGTAGNVMVLLAVFCSRRLQTSSNVFLVNLSITDLLVSVAQPFQAVAMITGEDWPLPDVICEMVAAFAITTVCCSVLTISLIALNRYVLITRTKETYQRIYTRRNIVAMVAFTWVYPLVTLVIPQATGQHGRLGYDPLTRLCIWDFLNPGAKLYIILAAILSVASFNICFISYCLIYRHFKKHALSTRSTIVCRQSAGRAKRRQRKDELIITKNLTYVMCGFFLFISPYTGLFMVLPYLEGSDLEKGLHVSSYAAILLVMDSCLNPLIYAIKLPHFRTVFACMIRLRLREIPEPSRHLARLLRHRSHDQTSSANSETQKSRTENSI